LEVTVPPDCADVLVMLLAVAVVTVGATMAVNVADTVPVLVSPLHGVASLPEHNPPQVP
jgi:hypothetical protein